MIVTRSIDYEALDPRKAQSYSVKRETLRECFSFLVSWEMDERFAKERPLGWQQLLYRRILYQDYACAICWYQIIPLCFISDAIWIFNERVWYAIGRRVKRAGYLGNLPDPGTVISWFWPRYISIRKDARPTSLPR